MSSPSVQFYEKMKDLQDNQHRSEQKRLELEQQLHVHMKSDSRLARLKAVRLQNYWKKICEDEKKSQWRNEQLLKDLERIDAHVENMSSITNKLRTKKKQYEEYIERTYPQWKEKVIQYQQQRKASNEAKERQLNAEAEGRSQFAEEQLQLQQQVLQKHNDQLNFLLQEKDKQQHYTQSPQAYGRPGSGSYGQMQGGNGAQGYQASMGEVPYQPTSQNLHQPRVNFQATPEMHRHSGVDQPHQHQQHAMGPSGVSTLQTVSTLPTGLSATPQVPLQQQGYVNQQQGTSSQSHKIPTASQGMMYTTQEEDEQSDRDVDLSVGQLSSPRKTPRSPHKHASDGAGSPRKVAKTPPISPRGEKKVEKSPRPSYSDMTLDDGSDFESDSLPLSDTKEKPASPVPTPTPRKSSLKPETQTPRATSEAEVYPEPDVTRDGFYNMLSAVQDDFASTRDPEAFYRSPGELMKSVEKQIYENANKGANLMFSSTSISMAVLEQVPLLALDCEGGYLLPDSILKSFPADINEETVRESIRRTSVGLWEKLLEHFKAMMKYQVMEPYNMADIFAPHLIGARSKFSEEAKNLVTALLENLPQEALVMTPNSTTTFSSLPMSARKPQPEDKPKPREEVPPLDLEFETTENTNDDFFDKPVPKPTTMPTNPKTLTQSAAYKALLGTGSTMEPDTDSSEDDIEKTLNFGSERKESPRKPMFSGPGPQGDGAVSTERPPSPESSLSPAPSPRAISPEQKVSYVPPAASDKPAKSSLQLTGSSAGKSPRLYGIIRDSDTDEDIEIPSAGASGNRMAQDDDDDEYDDADFYQ